MEYQKTGICGSESLVDESGIVPASGLADEISAADCFGNVAIASSPANDLIIALTVEVTACS